MEFRTSVKDLRVTYDGLGTLLRYKKMPGYAVNITRAEYREEDGKDYFYVDCEITAPSKKRGGIERTLDFLNTRRRIEFVELETLLKPIGEMGFSGRVEGALEYAKIRTLNELLKYGEKELLKIPSFGRGRLKELNGRLAEWGVCLKPKQTRTSGG